jgi:hypothetical protein
MVAMLSIGFTSCGGDDENENPNNGQPVNPGTTVNDPEGTISLSMRNADNGKTYLDNIYISNENFRGAYFASVGVVKGLGNVSTIPTTGWAEQMSVIAGNGYVAYSNNQFYRIYVVSDIVATTGGIIGADIKYQKPFKGVDEAISVDEKTLTFNANGGSQSLVFNNKNIVIFDAASNQSWCHVQKSSTYDNYFLYNAVTISVDKKTSPDTDKATVFLTTAYDKKIEITINRLGPDPILELSESESNISGAEQTFNVGFTTNYSLDEIEISNSNDWLKSEIVNGTRGMQARASNVSFIGEKEQNTTRVGSNTGDASSYYIRLTASTNYDNQARTGQIILRTKDNKLSKTLTVRQSGVDIEFTKENIEFECASSTGNVQFTSLIDTKDLKVESNSNWCTASLNGKYVYLIVTSNKTNNERNAQVTLSTTQGNASAVLTVRQKKGEIIFSDREGITMKNVANTINTTFTSPYEKEELKVNSNEDWCTPSIKSINQLSISVLENPYDKERNATITLSSKDGNVKNTLKVTQEAATMNVQSEVWLDRKSSTQTLNIETSLSHWTAKSNVSWCTVSQNGNQLTLRIEATSEDRQGTISFEGLSKKVELIQSKYAVGDEYSENGLEGKVLSMKDEVRFIYKDLGEYQWSTEYIETGARDYYDGTKNMEVIKKIPNWKILYPAFAAADALNTDGEKSWIFPADGQLRDTGYNGTHWLYGEDRYWAPWTSTELTAYRAIPYGISGGSYWESMYYGKDKLYHVIVIHNF